MTEVSVFDNTQCLLGEGPLWHPERQQFFWFDINAKRLYTRTEAGQQHWQFVDYVSAAGWVDHDTLLVAAGNALWHFNIETGKHQVIRGLEAINPATRANDGRADPYGGFWIGTMALAKTPRAGTMYRYYKGELRVLFPHWTIPNAQCFSPDGLYAYYADTPRGKVWRHRLDDKDGWPVGEPEVFLDLPASHYRPDGAVVDAKGNFWCAHFGHSKVTCHSPEGKEIAAIKFPASQTTCPAFGGADLATMFVTSAAKVNHNGDNISAREPAAGRTYVLHPGATGQAEYRVIL